MLKLFDTARAEVAPLTLNNPGSVSMYVCGPTVYGPAHLGHGRFSLVFDILRRYLEWTGLAVTYVSNITDIDDKIIARAAAENRPWTEVVAEFEAAWWATMDAIGVKRPTHVPHATEYVDQMVDFIARLLDTGAAYRLEDGVYFRCERVDDYGKLARQSVESLRTGARVDVDSAKESPIDFALWKFSKPGEPTWSAPFGDGRPGWHTECVVMSTDVFGPAFDLHGGGLDLAFPHHENERAQACACGYAFAGHWVHNGFVEVEGEKMSKSLGNFTDMDDLIERHDPRAYRMLCLQAHYRSPIEVSAASITSAEGALGRIDALIRRAGSLEAVPDQDLLDRFAERMNEDLDTPGALVVMFEAVSGAHRLLDERRPDAAAPFLAAVRSMAAAVGIDLLQGEEIPADVAALCSQRDAARSERDWARSDAIREALRTMGWIVEDTPEGTMVHRG